MIRRQIRSRSSTSARTPSGWSSIRARPAIPSVIFNEKVMAGLGQDVGETGAIARGCRGARAGRDGALRPAGEADGGRRAPAPSPPPRSARPSNGAAFLAQVAQLGLEPRILSGEEEGKRAGQGVLSAIPEADGIVGDLGGGSLELVEVARRPGEAQRLAAARRAAPRRARREGRHFAERVAQGGRGGGLRRGRDGRPFYMVGGTWRALARLDMALIDHPLPITHQHCMETVAPAALLREIAERTRPTFPTSARSPSPASRPCPMPPCCSTPWSMCSIRAG